LEICYQKLARPRNAIQQTKYKVKEQEKRAIEAI